MTHPLKTRNAHFSKTLATFALLTGLLVACGDGASMPDDMNPDEGGTSGTTATGTGGSDNGSGGTLTNTATGGTGTPTGGETPDGTGGAVATGGTSNGGAGGTSTGGAPATGGVGGTVSSEVPKPRAELTPNDFIPFMIYVLFKDDADQKLKIGQASFPSGGWPGCKGYANVYVPPSWYFMNVQGTYIRTAKVVDFGKYENSVYDLTGKFDPDFIMGYSRDYTPSQADLESRYNNAASIDNPNSNCAGLPKE